MGAISVMLVTMIARPAPGRCFTNLVSAISASDAVNSSAPTIA